MKISLAWLNELLKTRLAAADVSEAFSQAGLPVESVRRLDAECEGVLVGEIRSIAPHPNADRLRVVEVRIGPNETRRIVCGASNIVVGQKVPVARPGSRLANSRVLEAATIRGVHSEGMICGEDELGFGGKHGGVLVLEPKAPVGAPLSRHLGLDDVSLELEVTPNRADCLSAIGLARELAAIRKLTFRPRFRPIPGRSRPPVRVTVLDRVACPFYSARLIRGVNNGPSPAWLRARLLAGGIRPAGLIVDVTNYVMLELGQPLHAFDADRIPNHAIVVRRAEKGEKLRTLDGIDRTLGPETLVIADRAKPIALAGVLGGVDTEVRPETKNIILESAVFAPSAVRKTARSLRLLSEASQRFERGIDRNMTELALDRAAQLLLEHGGGKLDGGKTIVAARPAKPAVIPLDLAFVNDILNLKLSPVAVRRRLVSLGCAVRGTVTRFRVTPPSWRVDLKIPEDLVEEIARLEGYQNLKPTRLNAELKPVPVSSEERLIETARSVLIRLGYLELFSRATNPGEQPSAQAWSLANPIDPKDAVLRRSLLPNLERAVRGNLERSPEPSFGGFEIGTVFLRPLGAAAPVEEMRCGATFWRAEGKPRWSGELAKRHTARLFQQLILPVPTFASGEIRLGGETVGQWTTAEETVVGRQRYFRESWEVSLTKLLSLVGRRTFRPLPQFPPVKRDLALWVPNDLDANELFATIRKASSLVTSIEPFDLYEKDGRQSVALHLVFQALDRTLRAEAVESALRSVLASLHSLNVTPRI